MTRICFVFIAFLFFLLRFVSYPLYSTQYRCIHSERRVEAFERAELSLKRRINLAKAKVFLKDKMRTQAQSGLGAGEKYIDNIFFPSPVLEACLRAEEARV